MWQGKKIFVCLLLVAALVPMAANATVSRLEGLGGSGDPYWWNTPGNVFVMHDAATPSIWPQLVQQYPNLAGGEFHDGTGAWDLEKVYVNYSWGEKKAALQFSLDQYRSMRFFSTAFLPVQGFDGTPSRLNINYGRKLGDDMLLGVGLSYWGESASTKDDPNTTPANEKSDMSASIIGLKVGLSGTGDREWDAVVGIELPSFTNEAGADKISENDGSMGIHFAGRYWWNYSEKASLIPNVRFNTYKDGATYPTTSPFAPLTAASVSHTQIAIGAGHNWWPVENALVLFDFGIALQTESYEFTPAGGNYDEKDNFLPYWRVGFETTVFSWLDGRLGAERFWDSRSLTGDAFPTEPSASTSVTNTFIGGTAHWNRMALDMVMNPGWFEDGPNFISGGVNDLLYRLSLKYDFNQ